jgi:hypothetical protein
MLPRVGPALAGCLVASAAVLVFFWGLFYLARVITGRLPWLLTPCFAMLSYGLVFQFGFLNYFTSVGLSLWVLALLWSPTRGRACFALLVAILAVLAHPLPVVWMASVLVYRQLSLRIGEKWQLLLLPVGVACLWMIRAVLTSQFPYRWSSEQFTTLEGLAGVTGVEQVWLFGPQYLIVVGGLLMFWSALFLSRLDQGGVLRDPIFQLWILHLAAVILLPSALQFPQHQHVLAYIPQRISLLSSVFLCLLIAGVALGRGMARFLGLVAAVFFTCLYLDGALERFGAHCGSCMHRALLQLRKL